MAPLQPSANSQGPVSVVVLDNDVLGYARSLNDPTHSSTGHTTTFKSGSSDYGSPELGFSGSGYPDSFGAASPDARSFQGSARSTRSAPWLSRLTRNNIPAAIRHFCGLNFDNSEVERLFLQETWKANKPSAMLCALWLLLIWVLSVTLKPHKQWELWGYWVVIFLFGIFTIPLPFFVWFDLRIRCPSIYQLFLLGAVWSSAFQLLFEMHFCQFFSPSACGGRNFMYTFVAAFGPPTLAIIGMQQNRFLHVLLATSWFLTGCCLIMVNPYTDRVFVRNFVAFELYHLIIAMACYYRECTDRRVFSLSLELQEQIGAVRQAREMEKNAEESKKRFVSYIFHEVRVPLNTALLVVQNLDAEGGFARLEAEHQQMVHGLMGSLTMMEKVLNDVLSFNRMDSGNLVLARKPFNFHKAIQVVHISHQLAADVRNLDLIVDLDPRIDHVGGTFIGDEMRLRQVVSNLVSNAVKFTSHGSVRIVTKLLYSHLPERHSAHCHLSPTTTDSEAGRATVTVTSKSDLVECIAQEKDMDAEESMAASIERQKSCSHPEASWGSAVVRVEVHDTGAGLRPKDLDGNGLFSPYVQTELGRRQAGKGSGLGLALCRQIVRLSHGRIGVDSEHGKGSVFWFEIPYFLPQPSPYEMDDAGSSVFRQMLATSEPMVRSPAPDSASALRAHRLSPKVSMTELPSRSPNSTARSCQGSGGDVSPRISPHTVPVATVPSPVYPTSARVTLTRATSEAQVSGRQPKYMTHRPSKSQSHSTVQRASTGSLAPDDIKSADPWSAASSLEQAFSYPPPLVAGSPGTSVCSGLHPKPLPSELSGGGFPWNMPEDRPAASPSGSPVLRRQRSLNQKPTVNTLGAAPPSPEQADKHAGCAKPAARPPVKPKLTRRSTADQVSVAAQLSPISPAVPLLGDNPPPLHVLVVDDDSLTRSLMCRMINRLGHDVSMAEHGKAGLEVIRDAYQGHIPMIDIVFLDNQMPFLSGVEVVAQLRAWPSDLYVIGCTGNALREDQDEYLAAGADGLITKPVHQVAIADKLAEAVRRRGVREAARERAEVWDEAQRTPSCAGGLQLHPIVEVTSPLKSPVGLPR